MSQRVVALTCFSLVLVLLSCCVTARGQAILLQPVSYLQAAGTQLKPGYQAIPCAADWNGDGRKDLLVGYRYDDKIALYLNSGSDAEPVFTQFVNLKAGGVDIQHPSVGCGAPAPWVCDYDGDGKRDLLVGTGAEGYVFFYRNTNTDAQPILAPGVKLMVGAVVLSVGARATPYVHDWDEDGLPDLLCGDANGFVNLFRNIGTRQQPVYAPGVRIQAAGVDLNCGIRSAVRVVDWDGDGVKDLVCSGSGKASWCRNLGSNSSPRLAAPVPLGAPVPAGTLAPINTGDRMRLDIVDWNDDGVPDLLIGDSSGYVTYWQGYHFTLTSIAPESGQAFSLQWRSAPYLRYNLYAGSSIDGIWSLVATNLPSSGTSTRWTNQAQGKQEFYRVAISQ